jgi:hypothetical protein
MIWEIRGTPRLRGADLFQRGEGPVISGFLHHVVVCRVIWAHLRRPLQRDSFCGRRQIPSTRPAVRRVRLSSALSQLIASDDPPIINGQVGGSGAHLGTITAPLRRSTSHAPLVFAGGDRRGVPGPATPSSGVFGPRTRYAAGQPSVTIAR